MGCLSSSGVAGRRKRKSDAQIRQIEIALLFKVLKFDLNLGEKVGLTIENRFTSENTNDMGEGLMPQTAHIIITEFKKFMYLLALQINKARRDKTLDLTRNFKKDNQWYYLSPYTAPPYIDRVWKLLILYSKNYEELCQKV